MQIRWKRCVCSICCASQGRNRCCNRAPRENVGSNGRNIRISPARAPRWASLLADVVLDLFAEIVEPSCSIWLDRAVMRPSCCFRACVMQKRRAGLQCALGIRINPHRRPYGCSALAASPEQGHSPSRTFTPRIHPYKLQPPTATRFAGGTEDGLKVTE